MLISSYGSDPNSWLMLQKTKGEVERDLALKKMNLLTVLRPALLMNRKDRRMVEKVLGFLPLVPKINALAVAQSAVLLAERER